MVVAVEGVKEVVGRWRRRASRAGQRTLWSGRPWIAPAVALLTVGVVALALLLTWLELLAFGRASMTPFSLTYLGVAILWAVGAGRLALIRASNAYTLRESGLEIRRGLLLRRVSTVSPSGFSGVEVTKTLAGRMLNFGRIVVNPDGDAKLAMVRVRDPVAVASAISRAMTVVRSGVAAGGPTTLGPSGAEAAARLAG